MNIDLAGPEDVGDLARLLWLHAAPDEQDSQTVDAFAVDLGQWLSGDGRSHRAFVGGRVDI